MDGSNLAPLMKSERMDWNTPPIVLDAVRQMAPIGFDPCSNASSVVGAAHSETKNGLTVPWEGKGLIFVNPPYGREISAWMQRASNVTSDEVICLVPARPDTRWFVDYIWSKANAICWWRGRITFLGAPSAAPFPNVIVYYGPFRSKFKRIFSAYGMVTFL